MANEMRLVDANDPLKQISDYTEKLHCSNDYIDGLYRGMEIAESYIKNAPTVDAVVLPCEVGTQIWLTEWRCDGLRWRKLIEPKPRTINHFDITKYGVFAHFKDGYVNIKDFGETVFLTKEEAKAALAKMDGGNEYV